MAAPNVKRVLFVDDNPQILSAMSEILRRARYEVSGANDADEALLAFSEKQEGFDVVILNYIMPGKNGLAVARTMKSLRPDVPIILFTGAIWGDIREKAEREGIADEHLPKPATADELFTVLKKVCEKTDTHDGFCVLYCRCRSRQVSSVSNHIPWIPGAV